MKNDDLVQVKRLIAATEPGDIAKMRDEIRALTGTGLWAVRYMLGNKLGWNSWQVAEFEATCRSLKRKIRGPA